MTAQSPGKVIHAAGAVPEWPDQNADCAAYKTAVEKWCAEIRAHKAKVAKWMKENNLTPKKLREMKKKGLPIPEGYPEFSPKGRKFNDYFYEALDPGVARRTAREVPLGIAQKGADGKIIKDSWKNLDDFAAANAGTMAGNTATRLQQTYNALTRGGGVSSKTGGGFWDGLRNQLNQRSGGLGKDNSPFYPDGLRDGDDAIEIKGPGDREGDSQFQKYADTAPGKKCIVVSPTSCGVDHELTRGGNCKAKAGT